MDVLFPHVTNELSISVQTDVCQVLSLVIKSFRTQQVLGILVRLRFQTCSQSLAEHVTIKALELSLCAEVEACGFV